MSATAAKNSAIYAIDNSVAFSTAFSDEATTESGVTRVYQIDDSAKNVWDINQAITVAGYWAFQEFGLSVASGDDSGLASTTQYYFKIDIDGGGVTEYDITTGGGTVTYANVVSLIDAQITGDGATCEFIDGDIRIHSDDTTSSSDISCSAGTTGTSLFGQGSIPAVGSLETVDYTDIALDLTYGTQGARHVDGKVQMLYTGFTSLTVSGYYHSLTEIANLDNYSLNINMGTDDSTDFGDDSKGFIATVKDGSFSCSGFFATEYWGEIVSGNVLYIKLYTNYSGTVGWHFFCIASDTVEGAVDSRVNESISGTIVGDVVYFSS